MGGRLPDVPLPATRGWRRRDAAVLIVSAAVLIGMRLHAFALPLETDECNYVYIADRLLAGDRLYVDVWDHQPPGVFALFAGATAAFGDGQAVFRWMAVGASLASMILIFAIARRAAGGFAGYLAAGLFALCSADPGTAGEGCNREIFMNPLALAAVWLLLRRQRPATGAILAAGLMLGLGSTLKTVMAAQWLLLAVWLAGWVWIRGEPGKRTGAVLPKVLLFGAGPALVWAAIFGYFAATGRLAAFHEAVFEFNIGYSEVGAGYWQRFIDFFITPFHRHVFDGTGALWITAGLATVVLPVLGRGRDVAAATALPCYLVGTYLAVCLPGQLWPHYYYLMLPPLIAGLATAFGLLSNLPAESPAARPAALVAFAAACVVGVSLLWTQTTGYLSTPTMLLTDLRYDSRDLWGRAQGRNVAKVTDPDDTILVYGHDVGVYYYSGRTCASRFTMVRALGEQYPGFEKRRAILLEEVKKSRPRVVLLVEEPFPALDAFLQDDYYLVGTDFHDRRPHEVVMAALMDKSRPLVHIDWNWHRSSVQQRD